MRAIQFAKGNFYHIYNRGVDKRTIFEEDNNRWRFLQGLCLFNDENNSSNILWQMERSRGAATLKTLKEYFLDQGRERKPLVRILAYCLMPNHYHLLLEEVTDDGITRFMHKFGGGYTRYFNNRYERSGSLFQGPFKALLVENEEYLQYLLIYINVMNPGQLIELNLKRTGVQDEEKILNFAEQYLWSSHQEYLDKRGSIILGKGLLGQIFSSADEYRNFAKHTLLGKKFDVINHLLLEDPAVLS